MPGKMSITTDLGVPIIVDKESTRLKTRDFYLSFGELRMDHIIRMLKFGK